jgi:YVTN family beta-propeller protein
MKHMSFKRLLASVLFLSSTIAFTACEKNPEVTPATYQTGVLVVNEGSFSHSNGAISYYNTTTRQTENDIFKKVNNRPLGDVVQSMIDHQNRSYIVVNNSNKVEVVEAATFRSVGVIEGLVMPRYMVAVGNKGFVTEWVGFGVPGRVSVVDLQTNAVTKTIPVGQQPERMLLARNGKLFVANAGGHTLSVINPTTETVEETVAVGDGPNSLVQDANNIIWVLAGGKEVYDANFAIDYSQTTAGRIVRFNPEQPRFSPAQPFDQQGLIFLSNQRRPAQLQTNREGTKLYFLLLNRESSTGKLYEMAINASILPQTNLVAPDFYGFGIDPSDNTIFAAEISNFTSPGQIHHYFPSGDRIETFQADIGPNGFVFRR